MLPASDRRAVRIASVTVASEAVRRRLAEESQSGAPSKFGSKSISPAPLDHELRRARSTVHQMSAGGVATDSARRAAPLARTCFPDNQPQQRRRRGRRLLPSAPADAWHPRDSPPYHHRACMGLDASGILSDPPRHRPEGGPRGPHTSKGQELVTVADHSQAAWEEACTKTWELERAYGSYDELYADSEVDAVYISLPDTSYGSSIRWAGGRQARAARSRWQVQGRGRRGIAAAREAAAG